MVRVEGDCGGKNPLQTTANDSQLDRDTLTLNWISKLVNTLINELIDRIPLTFDRATLLGNTRRFAPPHLPPARMLMITFILGFNLVVSLVCLFIAWKLWRWRLSLARAATVLSSVERQTHRVLSPAPHYIMIGERGTHNLRNQLQRLDAQLQHIRQLLGILSLGLTIWKQRQQITRLLPGQQRYVGGIVKSSRLRSHRR